VCVLIAKLLHCRADVYPKLWSLGLDRCGVLKPIAADQMVRPFKLLALSWPSRYQGRPCGLANAGRFFPGALPNPIPSVGYRLLPASPAAELHLAAKVLHQRRAMRPTTVPLSEALISCLRDFARAVASILFQRAMSLDRV
jgi:hypothetical protein